MFNLCEEPHFKFSSGLVDLEELFEALFEDRVAEGVSHDVVAAGRVEAGLHLEDTDLVEGCHKQVDHDACFLGTGSQILVVLDSLLKMFSIIFFLLYIQMRPNLLLKRLRYDHARSVCDRPADQSHHAGPPRGTSRCFQQTDADVEGGAHAALGAETVFHWPGVWLQVIQNGVKGEFTLTHGDKETFDSSVVSLVQGVRGESQTQLVLDLSACQLFVTTEHIGFGAVCETQLMYVSHLTVGDQTDHGILRDKVD